MGPERFGDAIFWLDCPSVQKPNTRNTKSNGEISRLCQSAACLDKRTLRQIGPMDLWRICRDAPYQDTQQGVSISANAQSNRGRRAPLQRGEAQHAPRLSVSVERIVYVVTANRTCQPVNRCSVQCARARRSDRRSRSRGYPGPRAALPRDERLPRYNLAAYRLFEMPLFYAAVSRGFAESKGLFLGTSIAWLHAELAARVPVS
jgi:hypothetical protein